MQNSDEKVSCHTRSVLRDAEPFKSQSMTSRQPVFGTLEVLRCPLLFLVAMSTCNLTEVSHFLEQKGESSP